METKISRKQEILQVLADMLEKQPEAKLTTKVIANELDISEAAIYRYFPNKYFMFTELIDFIEESIFSIIKRISHEDKPVTFKIQKLLEIYLTFAEKNPGLSRIITGEALIQERDYRLFERMALFSNKLESFVKQILRDSYAENVQMEASQASIARLLIATCEGLILKFNRSNFKNLPTQYWPEIWQSLEKAIF